jgi:hypothetical protein
MAQKDAVFRTGEVALGQRLAVARHARWRRRWRRRRWRRHSFLCWEGSGGGAGGGLDRGVRRRQLAPQPRQLRRVTTTATTNAAATTSRRGRWRVPELPLGSGAGAAASSEVEEGAAAAAEHESGEEHGGLGPVDPSDRHRARPPARYARPLRPTVTCNRYAASCSTRGLSADYRWLLARLLTPP